jgi:hypothetical protein
VTSDDLGARPRPTEQTLAQLPEPVFGRLHPLLGVTRPGLDAGAENDPMATGFFASRREGVQHTRRLEVHDATGDDDRG